MHTSGIEDYDKPKPPQAEEIHALIEQLGECIIDEVLFRVNQELGKLKDGSSVEPAYDPSQILGGEIPRQGDGYTLQDQARYDEGVCWPLNSEAYCNSKGHWLCVKGVCWSPSDT